MPQGTQAPALWKRGLFLILPFLLIVLGVLFVLQDVRGGDRLVLGKDVPKNLESTLAAYASPWAQRQLGASGDLVTDAQITVVDFDGLGPSVYRVRAVIWQVNDDGTLLPGNADRADQASLTTMYSCVEWQVDPLANVVNELFVAKLRTDRGEQGRTQDDRHVNDRCQSLDFGAAG